MSSKVIISHHTISFALLFRGVRNIEFFLFRLTNIYA